MRIRDWYFQGWERREENGRKVFVYTGEYYTFPGGLKTARSVCLPVSLAVVVSYLAAALHPSPGGMWHIAAIPQLLEVIPLLYLVIGAVCLIRAREPLTFRDWYASWRRMERSALGSAVLTACMVLAELVFIVLYARGAVGAELTFLLLEAGCLALSCALYDYIKKHPCIPSVTPDEKE